MRTSCRSGVAGFSEWRCGLAFINAAKFSVEKIVPAGAGPRGVCLSPDGTKLYVADAGAKTVGVIDAVNRTSLGSLALVETISDIAAGLGNRLYLTPSTQDFNTAAGILQIDATTGADQARRGDSEVYQGGFLQISPDRRTLYFGNAGLSGSTLEKFDVSASTALLLQRSDFFATGENGEGLTLSHNAQFLADRTARGTIATTAEVPTRPVSSRFRI